MVVFYWGINIIRKKIKILYSPDLTDDEVVNFFMNKIPQWKNVLGVDYIAKLLDVERRTVLNYINSGKLQTLPLPCVENKNRRAGVHKIPKKCFENFLRDCRENFNA